MDKGGTWNYSPMGLVDFRTLQQFIHTNMSVGKTEQLLHLVAAQGLGLTKSAAVLRDAHRPRMPA